MHRRGCVLVNEGLLSRACHADLFHCVHIPGEASYEPMPDKASLWCGTACKGCTFEVTAGGREARRTLSSAANSSVPGPFFHVPFMAVSSFASTAQYPAAAALTVMLQDRISFIPCRDWVTATRGAWVRRTACMAQENQCNACERACLRSLGSGRCALRHAAGTCGAGAAPTT